jgi:hypothetical protein
VNIRTVVLIFLLCGCQSVKVKPSEINYDTCQRMAGKDSQIFIPSEELKNELLASISVQSKYSGIIWFMDDLSTIHACSYTTDVNGCGINAYRIISEDGTWKSEHTFSLERVCFLG